MCSAKNFVVAQFTQLRLGFFIQGNTMDRRTNVFELKRFADKAVESLAVQLAATLKKENEVLYSLLERVQQKPDDAQLQIEITKMLLSEKLRRQTNQEK